MNKKIYHIGLILCNIFFTANCIAQVQIDNDGGMTQSECSIYIVRTNPLGNPNTFGVLNSNNVSDWLKDSWYCHYTAPFNFYYNYEGDHIWQSGEESGNGGANWVNSPTIFAGAVGDPTTVADLNGRWYMSYLDQNHDIEVASNPGYGPTWTPVTVTSGGGYDKPHLWVDSKRYTSTGAANTWVGTLYSAARNTNDDQVELFYSSDHDGTWHSLGNISQSLGSINTGVNIKTGPSGQVYVCWALNLPETGIGFASSPYGGSSAVFSTPTNIQSIVGSHYSTISNMKVNSFPCMAVNELNGDIMIVWTQGTGGSGIINMIKSTDGGSSWTSMGTIGGPVSTNQFYPWIACDETSGAITVVFYGYSGGWYPFVGYSYNEGVSWNYQQLSTSAWNANAIPNPKGHFQAGYGGDYIGVDVYAGYCTPAWCDDVTGSHTQGDCAPNSNDQVFTYPFSILCDPNPWSLCSNPNTYNVTDYAFFQSQQDITAGGTSCPKFIVQGSTIEATMQSEKAIYLEPGFQAKSGCYFHGTIAAAWECGLPPHEPVKNQRNDKDSIATDNNLNKANHASEEKDSNSISVYPNPNNGSFTLSLSNINTSCAIEVYNVLGAKICAKTLPEGQTNTIISLNNQPNGVYFFRVIKENGQLAGQGKIVVER